MSKGKWDNPITNYAFLFYWDEDVAPGGLCSLCGNQGIIDTTQSAISPLGFRPGRKNWCICPNGQFQRSLKGGTGP